MEGKRKHVCIYECANGINREELHGKESE